MSWPLRAALALATLIASGCPHANPTRKTDGATDGGGAGGDAVPPGDALPPGDGTPGQDATSGDGSPSDGSTSNLLRERSCRTTVTFRPQGGRDVFIAGEWDGWRPDATRLSDPEGDGTFTGTVNLAPGLYAYKFVVDGNWILDPSHKYRAYHDNVENSGLRVPNCREPLLELAGTQLVLNGMNRGAGTILLRYTEANGGTGPDPNRLGLTLRSDRDGVRPLSANEWSWNAAAWELTVTLAGLADGKYTVTATATSLAGTSSNRVTVPFWVEADRFDWRDAIIYMVLTDRFRDGDPANNPAPNPASVSTADYYGGDLIGVTQAIRDGYFDSLGVKSIWLTPFNVNPPGEYADGDGVHNVTGYHGYWPAHPRRVDDRIGGDAALREMVAAAHQHGIRILMDYVINHVHEDHPYVREHPDWFSTLPAGCICGTNNCDWTARRLDCLFKPYMPDVNWQNNTASEVFIADAIWWLDHFDLDGLRVDAVKHVPDGAIFNLSSQIEEQLERAGTIYFRVGETAMGWGNCDPVDPGCNAENYGTISRYLGPQALHGQFDFVLHHSSSLAVWAYDNYGLIHADVWTRASQARYPQGSIMTPYVGSHDTPRFVSHVTHPNLTGNKWPEQTLPPAPQNDVAYRRLGLALTWNLTIPGAPLLYYGDEYGEFGGADPDNRHWMRFDAARTQLERDLAGWIAAVGSARLELPALRRGTFSTLAVSETFWAYLRSIPASGQWAIVAINKSAQPVTQEVQIDGAISAPVGTMLRDRIGGATIAVETANRVRIQLPAFSAAILAP